MADAAGRRRAQRDVADAGWLEVSRVQDADVILSAASGPARRSEREPRASAAHPVPVLEAREEDLAFATPREVLTARELQVLRLLAEGLGNRDIAERLGLSEHTVKFHLSAIFGKLGASTRTDTVRRALRIGLIDL
jgi:DNA-binding NarL/FixJ family response regulator